MMISFDVSAAKWRVEFSSLSTYEESAPRISNNFIIFSLSLVWVLFNAKSKGVNPVTGSTAFMQLEIIYKQND